MANSLSLRLSSLRLIDVMAIATAPAVVVFISSNIVNVGNLAFNMIFSRWMGPELFGDLALVLTIKLALLGVIGAVQMAVSQVVAGATGSDSDQTHQALAQLSRRLFVALWLLLPIFATLLWKTEFSASIGLGSPYLLLILLVSMPFAAPLSILRGAVFGLQNTGRIVLSANLEMGVRLLGAAVAWQAGLGIEGVVLAICLSIVAGWAALLGVLPTPKTRSAGQRPIAKIVAISAFPFAVLQLAQVLALDGDIFLVSSLLPSEQAGFVAALSLFQRIQFFACFALASILLPSVVAATRTGGSILQAAAPVAILYLAVAFPFLIGVELWPNTLIDVLVGSEFQDAASGLRPAALAAVAFTMSFLLATFLAALGDYRGIWTTAGVAVLQLALIAQFAAKPGASFVDLVQLKAVCQGALCLCLLLYSVVRVRRHLTGCKP
ncbi:hypothetical protein [Actibacterium lipolyticum]|uniref:Multidrug resistance protein NorM n=1 Tax=Actibacterium lipolyticum TaxID=1524263 RepID=A0A238JKC6_9RHOB|nr:hypothetical protein [Actibacterium lipolyticum]SMX31100.1 hypothetical protein COL8621_00277 [Actibacterium lipolyticum]